MFVNSDLEHFRGYTPSFVKTVQAKRRREELERQKIEAKVRRELRRAKMDELRAKAIEEVEKAPPRRQYVAPSPKTAREIIERVADAHEVSLSDILGPSRRKHIVVARHEAIAAIRRARPDWSLPQIGKVFDRDHTTIISALRKMGVRTARLSA